MQLGTVSANREATARLPIRGPHGQEVEVEVVIDTGFTGFLTLPASIIARLSLPARGSRLVTLADGSTATLSVFRATVILNGQQIPAQVLASDGGPLLGMALLYGFRLTLDVIDGGTVTLETLI